MACRSQHPKQVMEHQTSYDINADINRWKQELAAQPGLTIDNRRELETHLHDTVTELQKLGLNDEESFWLACRRIGPPQDLSLEFLKASPLNLWSDRVFWMALTLVGSYLFMTWKDLLTTWSVSSTWIDCLYLIPLLTWVGSAVMFRYELLPQLNYPEKNRNTKRAGVLLILLVTTLLAAYCRSRHLPSDGNGIGNLVNVGYHIRMVTSWFSDAIWPMTLVLILFFTSKRKPKWHEA